jgi:FMN phosphatase YigB (HAD superfamily)
MSKKYKTIFFDWNNTLSTSLFWDQLNEPNHPRHDWYQRIADFVFAENQSLVNSWMKGDCDHKYVAKMISEKFGYPLDTVLSDLIESCRRMKIISPEVLPLVKRLREKGIKCVIATDNMDTFAEFTVPALKLNDHFDDILVSCDKKIFKFEVNEKAIPFFDDYLEDNELSYRDVVLFDDNGDKTGTYQRLGFDIQQVAGSADFIGRLQKLTS